MFYVPYCQHPLIKTRGQGNAITRKMAAFRIIVVFCVIFLSNYARGIVNIDQEKKQKIDNFVNSLLSECDRYRNVVGMTLAIVHKGEIL